MRSGVFGKPLDAFEPAAELCGAPAAQLADVRIRIGAVSARLQRIYHRLHVLRGERQVSLYGIADRLPALR